MTTKKLRNFTPHLCGVILLIGVFSACKKPTLNGTGTLPDEQLNFTVTDTLTVTTVNELDDPVRTDELTINQWGALNDPKFGKSYAGMYIQFSTDRSNIDLGDSLVLDSIVLSLAYASGSKTYGDVSTVGQNMYIHRINTNFFEDSAYYNNTVFDADATPVGDILDYKVNDDDTIRLAGIGLVPGIQIKLDNSLGQDLLNQSGGANLASDEAFKNYFRGLYVAPDSTNPGNGLVYFDIFNTFSRLTLYYNDTSSIDFFINTNSASVNRFNHDFTGSEAANSVGNTNNDSLIYVKPMGGSRGLIKVPHIDSLGLIAINQAQLTVTVLNDDTSAYELPNQMFVVKVGADGEEELVSDQFVSEDFFDGFKKAIVDSSGNILTQYTFNLPRYYQSIINGETDYGLHLLTFPTTRISNRVLVGGGNHAKYKTSLRLVYTKIEE